VDQPSPINRKLIAGLALAGLASGVLSIISSEPLSNIPRLQELRLLMYVPGAIFGVFISAYYAIFGRIRSWARLLAFVAASVAAYFLALVLSVYTVVSFRPLGWSRESAFYVAMFLGGLVGAFVILAAAQLLLSTRRKWKAILNRALLWSLAGGLLGVLGFALGGSLGKLLWLVLHAMHLTLTDADVEGAVRTQTVNVFSLFVLWQACMAPLLGWLVSKSSAAQPDHQSAASA
jgi:hypothetical protein